MDDAAHTNLLFVYGTLRRGCGHEMHRVLAFAAGFVDAARFRGRLYRVADYPGAIASDDPRDQVLGELYRLHAPAAVLARLDAYEGVGTALDPGEFERRIVRIEPSHGAGIDAWIYLYRRSTLGLERIHGGDYLVRSTDL
jgi:gamma-glutamylcyclotransferase (GGCT)/AIG2-like uncharacterized protein YtfP